MIKKTAIFGTVLVLSISAMVIIAKRSVGNESIVVLNENIEEKTKEEYVNETVQELLDEMDWTGKKDEKEEYKMKLIEQM